MGLKKFQVVFDNPWNTYYSGQPVSGRIIIAVDTQKKIRGLVVHFKGEASVKWDVTETKKNEAGSAVQETTVFTGQEQYFENKFNVLGGGGNEVFIEPGEHSYPFMTYLPPNLPSSFEGEFGHVRYTVKATLDRPWKFDQDVKAAFTVISPLDLNLQETAKNPVKLEKEKYFCCCCCKSGPLTLVLSLPVGGYVPGQAIPVTVELDNNSGTNVANVICTLRKIVSFKATSPSNTVKKDKITIVDHKFGGVTGNSSKTWTEQIVIPPLPPSNLMNCNIIDLSYDMKVEAKLPGVYPNAELKTPIILGTIPLINYQPPPPIAKEGEGQLNPGGSEGVEPAGPTGVVSGGGWNSVPQQDPNAPAAPQWGQSPGAPQDPSGPSPAYPQQPQWGPPSVAPVAPPDGSSQPGPNPPSAGYPQQPQWAPPTGPYQPPQGGPPSQDGVPDGGTLYPTLPPPAFAESAFGPKNIQDSTDNQHTHGNMQFAPRYPVYNYNTNPQQPSQPQ
ncbi:hypothetical protein R5R35_004789 [Gryllus longicercus]|uniref:Arrestin C-terminal-like domain-containing protein n=1 Tax=Gryllus longicercus TaxID=2509291 RepID=A0AAN9VNV7_9ORTH